MRWAAALLLLAALARADGKVFGVGAKVAIPDQSALLVWRDGTETLVVETAFRGEGTDFAWIVPLPAVPEIEAATRGLFPTLRALTAPEVISGSPQAIGPLTFLLALAGLILSIVVVLRRRLGRAARVTAGLLVGLFLVVSGASLGFLAPRGALEATGVSVRARQVVGSYDTVVLSGTDGAPVRAWLEGHGFRVPAEATPVLDAYASSGWVFAAARLRAGARDPAQATHPLAFTFAAERPVYPLRLTGAGQERLRLDLYVCAERGARADGLEITFRDRFTHDPDSRRDIPLLHEGLRRFARGTSVLTKLEGTLSGAALDSDLAIGWEASGELRPVRWTNEAAGAATRDAAGLLVVALAVVLAAVIDRHRSIGAIRILTLVAAGMLAEVAAMGIVHASLPRIEEVELENRLDRVNAERNLVGLLSGSRSLEEARQRLREAPPGLPPEIDAPHGFGLRDTPRGPELVLYGRAGGERRVLRLVGDE